MSRAPFSPEKILQNRQKGRLTNEGHVIVAWPKLKHNHKNKE